MKERATARRAGITFVVAVAAVLAFAAVGGTGLAGGLAKPGKAQYAPGQYKNSDKKVTICHKAKVTIRVSVNALPAHTQHGDDTGMCPALVAAKAKAAKAANAAKAAKAAKADDGDETTSTASGPGKSQGKGSSGNSNASNGKGNGKK
jgi:hypothetical protein